MTEHAASEPACEIRASAEPGGAVRLYARHLAFTAEGQMGYQAKGPHPSALDYLLAALAADAVSGLTRTASRAGARLEAVELTLAARFANPLVPLGVVGEEGSAALSEVVGSLYLSSDLSEQELRSLWEDALRRAPVYATLTRCVPVRIELKVVI